MFFDQCTTQDEVRRMYRRLAKIHHPDIGGDTATMAAINAEYERFTVRRPSSDNANYQQQRQEQPKKKRRKTVYSEDVLRRFQSAWTAEGLKTATTEDGHKVFYSWIGYRFFIFKYECTMNGKKFYTKRCYNDIPKKYYYCTIEREWN